MFIKEINIEGFRSYAEATKITDFSPKHNVVVGRNGSGKSNFFLAIQLVLSNDFQTLNQELRQNMIHEGTGTRKTPHAKVEIVFDNVDRRMPTDANEVRIMRQVGVKRDQYFIDGKQVTRTDVVNLLETAGISRSNPYYIVKQGKVMELATAGDAYRLKVIREVAGTRVFDEKKEESLKVLEETTQKLGKSESLLGFIDERLKKLEEEKEDLKEYQKWDKTKRAIEYTVYDLEVKDARKRLDKLLAQRETLNHSQNQVETDLIATQKALLGAESDLRKLDARFKSKKDERDALIAENAERLEKKTKTQLIIDDLKEEVERERSGRDNAEGELERLKEDIAKKQEELEDLTPQYQELVKKEEQLASDVRIAEQKVKELHAKQGQRDQFRTVEERDTHLKKQMYHLDRQVDDVESQIRQIEENIAEEEQEEHELQEGMMKLQTDADQDMMSMDEMSAKFGKQKLDLDQAVTAQMNANREEKQLREQLLGIQQDYANTESDLRRITSRATVNGINSVNTVLEQMRQNNRNGRYDDVLNGYYGPVIDLFDCENTYYRAIEVTAESRLFYHVVENDQVAMKILKQINEQDLRGEVNFYPLNRVTAKARRGVQDAEARPMLEVMDFDGKFDVVFRCIFANACFVRSLQAGQRVAKNENFDCVTLEGDQVSRRGPMTGGYADLKRSKLDLSKTLRTLTDQRQQVEADISKASEKSAACATNVEKLRLEIQNTERELYAIRQTHKQNRRSVAPCPSDSIDLRCSKAQLVHLSNRVRELKAHRGMYEEQLGTDFHSQLSASERDLIEQLQAEIKAKRAQLDDVSRQRSTVENKKQRLENQLQSNLLRKRENLTAAIQDISMEEKRHRLQAESAEIKVINERLRDIMIKLNDLDELLGDYEAQREEFVHEIEQHQEKKRELESKVDDFAKQADLFCTKMANIQAKREEYLKKIREIGTLPGDAMVGRYANQSLKQLDKKLTECVNELKKYENVNKKALDQFVRASGQKEELQKRVDELKHNQKSIEDLLTVLENRRYETLRLTFKQVAKNFFEVFQKLIPAGRGDLIMKTANTSAADESAADELDLEARTRDQVEHFCGIGIKVSFTDKSGETREMSHLSGGQKSLVALAFIFAIQKCDPAPFYLFDEVDAALDAEHRRSVAAMIHDLSNTAQFITTTFRAELLEHADKYYGVTFRNKVSYIDPVDKRAAMGFIEDAEIHS
ncbi:chromosome associated protein [Aphelenchoides avenae]|nr:chromosome associated protein [Aphelenchus avenae]